MIDVGRAIQHPFEDKEWTAKMLAGAGIGLAPILNFALNGYMLEVMRNTSQGQDVPLPRWDNLSKYLTDGLKMLVVQLIYIVPFLVLYFVLMMLSIVLSGAVNNSSSSSNAVAAILGILTAAIGCVTFVYLLAFTFFLPALFIQLVKTDQISSVLRFREIIANVRKDLGSYVLVMVFPVVLAFGFGIVFAVFSLIPFVNICLMCVAIPAILLLNPYLTVVFGHLYGQLMRA